MELRRRTALRPRWWPQLLGTPWSRLAPAATIVATTSSAPAMVPMPVPMLELAHMPGGLGVSSSVVRTDHTNTVNTANTNTSNSTNTNSSSNSNNFGNRTSTTTVMLI